MLSIVIAIENAIKVILYLNFSTNFIWNKIIIYPFTGWRNTLPQFDSNVYILDLDLTFPNFAYCDSLINIK